MMIMYASVCVCVCLCDQSLWEDPKRGDVGSFYMFFDVQLVLCCVQVIINV